MSTGPRFIPGRSARRLSESCAICEARSGSYIASLISWPSCSRCSGDSDAIIRSAAACRRASASISSSTFSGFSGNRSPCLSMNSRNRSVVSSPRACAASSVVEVREHVLDRLHRGRVGVVERLLQPGELRVEHLALQHLLDRLVRRPRLVRVPVVRRQRPHRAGGVVGHGGQLHLRPARVLAVLGGELVALLGERLVERRADLVERAAEVAAAPGGVAHPADLRGEVVEAPVAVEPAAQQVRERLAQRPAREHVAADGVERRADVVRRGQRVGPVGPGAVAEPGHRYAP